MSLPCRSYAFFFAMITCVLSPSAPALAGDKVDGKRFFELESGGPHYVGVQQTIMFKSSSVRYDLDCSQ